MMKLSKFFPVALTFLLLFLGIPYLISQIPPFKDTETFGPLASLAIVAFAVAVGLWAAWKVYLAVSARLGTRAT